MKKYVMPKIEMLSFSVENVVTVSMVELVPSYNSSGDASYTINKQYSEIEFRN